MRSCQEITHIIASEGMGTGSVLRRLAVRFHLLWCRNCRRFVAELRRIAQAARAGASENNPKAAELEALEKEILTRSGLGREKAD